jgi:adenine-specific DNA methylase
VLDPFAEGRLILLEALHIGCETYTSDYKPSAEGISQATSENQVKMTIRRIGATPCDEVIE